jgi:hypothetical protein
MVENNYFLYNTRFGWENGCRILIFVVSLTALQPVYESAIMMMSERKELMYMFIEELANEDVAAVINDTNRGRIRKLEARIEDLEALLAEKDETIAKKDKQINELEQKKKLL